MNVRCNHCQAENLVADNQAAAPAPMCLACGQTMTLPQADAMSAVAAPQAGGAQDFEGSTVMVMRPKLGTPAAAASPAAVPGMPAPVPPPAVAGSLAEEEAWHALMDGTQQGPLTLTALRLHYHAKKLDEHSLLWRAGMAAWTPLAHLPDILAALQQSPAPAGEGPASAALLHLVDEAVHEEASHKAPQAVPAQAPTRPTVAPTRVVRSPPVAAARRRPLILGGAVALLLLAAVVGWLFLRAPVTPTVVSSAPSAAPAPAPPPSAAPTAPAAVTPPVAAPPAGPAAAEQAGDAGDAASKNAAQTHDSRAGSSGSSDGRSHGHRRGHKGHRHAR